MTEAVTNTEAWTISGDLAEWLEDQKMTHARGASFHPQTQGKIERWHQTMKNRVLLENYYLPGDPERQIGAFVVYFNNQRYHESLNTVTPADVYFGRDKIILKEGEKIKKQTLRQRRLQHQKQAAESITQTNQSLQNSNRSDVPFYMTTDKLVGRLTVEAGKVQTDLDRVLDRLVAADQENIIAAYEARIKKMQDEKRLIEDRIANACVSKSSFEESLEHALDFLTNPWKVWRKGQIEVRCSIRKKNGIIFQVLSEIFYDEKWIGGA